MRNAHAGAHITRARSREPFGGDIDTDKSMFNALESEAALLRSHSSENRACELARSTPPRQSTRFILFFFIGFLAREVFSRCLYTTYSTS